MLFFNNNFINFINKKDVIYKKNIIIKIVLFYIHNYKLYNNKYIL